MKNQSNVDANEIEKFSKIAARWWDLEGEFKPLHQINPLRLNYILERSNGIFGKQILDVGCGGGILAHSMAKEGANVTAIDMSDEALNVAKIHAKQTNTSVNYQLTTAEAHANANLQKYDIVTCMEMLEHVPDPASVINACAMMVKPGGHVFFSTLNRNPKSWLFAIVGAEQVLNLVPKGTHDHSKFIRPSELLRMANHSGLSERHITGLDYNPLTGVYSLKPTNVDVNYLVHTMS